LALLFLVIMYEIVLQLLFMEMMKDVTWMNQMQISVQIVK